MSRSHTTFPRIIDCNSISWGVGLGSHSLHHRNICHLPTEELQEHDYKNWPPGKPLQDRFILPTYAPPAGNEET